MPEQMIPIVDFFEAHLTVSDLNRAIGFYSKQLGLPLARVFQERKVAFFWIGAPGSAMLGLWEAGTMPIQLSLHVAFRVSLDHLLTSVPQLKRAGIEPRDFIGNPTDQPVVLAWMPAAAIYFRDLDNNQLELISMLPEAPQPELGILPWNQWVRRTPSNL